MTHKELFSDARWICPKSDADAALFRAEFINNKAQSAEIQSAHRSWRLNFQPLD